MVEPWGSTELKGQRLDAGLHVGGQVLLFKNFPLLRAFELLSLALGLPLEGAPLTTNKVDLVGGCRDAIRIVRQI